MTVIYGLIDQTPNSQTAIRATPDGALLIRPDAQARIGSVPSNLTSKFREAFQTLDPAVWSVSTAPGDIVQLEGNACAASYLTISLDPLTQNATTVVEQIGTFAMPFEAALGIHMSQRVAGHEFAVDVASDEAPLPTSAPVAISTMSQSSTTLTVNFASPHGLAAGMSIGIYGCSDSRFNYPQLTVASAPTAMQITCTGGPNGQVMFSLTAGPVSGGFVYQRSRIGGAPNGFSQIFDGLLTTATSSYARSAGGDALPSGTPSSSHAFTSGNSASAIPISAAGTYCFQPSTEYRLSAQLESITVLDITNDSFNTVSGRRRVTQVVPDPSRNYRLRIRGHKAGSVTTPVAKILNVSKSGSSTATVTTAEPHGLTNADNILAYGVRDQTNFPNLTTGTSITVTSPTTFTVSWGSSGSASQGGGYISRCQGNSAQPGAVTQSANSATVVGGVVTVTGSATWSGFVIGDLVNLHGIRDVATGADLGVDGVYRVFNVSGSTAIFEPVGWAGLSNMATTNCGGGVIRRSDFRISYVRVADFTRHRVEMASRGPGDGANLLPVGIHTSVPLTSNSRAINELIADISSAAITSTTTSTAVTPTGGTAYIVNVPVTAVSGTNPVLDIRVEESRDSGTNWRTVYEFPRIAGASAYDSPPLMLQGNRIRYVRTLGGTAASFTMSVNRIQLNTAMARPFVQLFDRSIVLTTLNSTTSSLFTAGCANLQLLFNVGAITTTAPQLQLEGSDDLGASWIAIGGPLTAVANSTVQATFNNLAYQQIRARVSTAGVGVTAGYVQLKGY